MKRRRTKRKQSKSKRRSRERERDRERATVEEEIGAEQAQSETKNDRVAESATREGSGRRRGASYVAKRSE